MNFPEVFIKSSQGLDELASNLRLVLNIPDKNQVVKDQDRESLNKGGRYYLFETLGCSLDLLINAGEVLIETMSDYQFYISIKSRTGNREVVEPLANHIAQYLTMNHIEAVAKMT